MFMCPREDRLESVFRAMIINEFTPYSKLLSNYGLLTPKRILLKSYCELFAILRVEMVTKFHFGK
jgi:hypothetical protein